MRVTTDAREYRAVFISDTHLDFKLSEELAGFYASANVLVFSRRLSTQPRSW